MSPTPSLLTLRIDHSGKVVYVHSSAPGRRATVAEILAVLDKARASILASVYYPVSDFEPDVLPPPSPRPGELPE